MSIPSNEDILALLAQLDDAIADAVESEFLDFKPSLGPKEDLKVACEYAVCFANAAGGVVVFGVADKQRGRAQAIVGTHGHDVDVFKRGIYDGTRPGIEAEVLELSVPEGTGKLLIVRVPEGQQKPYGTAAGLFKQRIDNALLRELLGLGDSPSAQVQASRLFKKWCLPEGFLTKNSAQGKPYYTLR
ncbi:MAG: ATP-binding protein [Burkholderiales bacterium]|nr:ATP-binding protein [Burkholderiales bacterium]